MSKLESLVHEFLAQKTIAVVGVSDRRETGCNANYRKFKATGHRVYAVNPRIKSFDGDPCFPDLKSLPEKPGGVFILANPTVTDAVVGECIELGVRYVWMHCMMGTRPGLAASISSVSPSAVERCKQNGLTVIPGTCPNQFLKPDFGHAVMRRMWTALGFLGVD